MIRIILCIFLLAGCSGQIHAENDLFAYLNKNNDQLYTHGTKFSYHETEDPKTKRTYSIGQNIYTPSHKHVDASPDDLTRERPYAGWLYGEYREADFNEDEKTKSVWGVQAGCSGPCSYAKETQVRVHKLLGQGYPTWDRNYALKSEPGIVLEKEKYYETFHTGSFYSDYYTLLKFGNIVDSASIGTSFKFGRRYSDFDPESITFKKAKEPAQEESLWSCYFFGNMEGRFVPYNHLLEGSIFQEERHTVDANLFVGEANLGFRLGYDSFKFSYNYTVVTEEWDEQNGPFFFGGLDLSW